MAQDPLTPEQLDALEVALAHAQAASHWRPFAILLRTWGGAPALLASVRRAERLREGAQRAEIARTQEWWEAKRVAERLAAEVARLHAALEKHGRHGSALVGCTCPAAWRSISTADPTSLPCACGLDAALEARDA